MASTSSNKMDYEDISEDNSIEEVEELEDDFLSEQQNTKATLAADSAFYLERNSTEHLDQLPALETGKLKRKSCRELFPAIASKQPALSVTEQALVSSSSLTSALPKLSLPQITKTTLRFAFEGKILCVYGTYDTVKENVRRFLRADLIDATGFGTITLVVGPSFLDKFRALLHLGAFIRIEGAVVTAKSAYDGGSVDVSLVVDATTLILECAELQAFVNFIPEITIRKFLEKAAKYPYLRGTLAFVIVQVDKIEKFEGGTYEQLTIADGPLAIDRATLTFVSKQKQLYHRLVEEFNRGNIIPYVARNIGSWKVKSNTLSILDVTVLMPVNSARLKNKLIEAFNKQVLEMGYGKQVYGTLEICNFNGTLAVLRCAVCKSARVNTLAEGGYCFSCEKVVDIDERLHLEGIVLQATDEQINVKLFGDVIDKVLSLTEDSLQLYHADISSFHLLLSETSVSGTFFVDNQGQIIGYTPPGIAGK